MFEHGDSMATHASRSSLHFETWPSFGGAGGDGQPFASRPHGPSLSSRPSDTARHGAAARGSHRSASPRRRAHSGSPVGRQRCEGSAVRSVRLSHRRAEPILPPPGVTLPSHTRTHPYTTLRSPRYGPRYLLYSCTCPHIPAYIPNLPSLIGHLKNRAIDFIYAHTGLPRRSGCGSATAATSPREAYRMPAGHGARLPAAPGEGRARGACPRTGSGSAADLDAHRSQDRRTPSRRGGEEGPEWPEDQP